MKLLISKNNKSRFTMDYKIVEDNEKFDENQFMEYGENVQQCLFANVVFQDGVFQYQPNIHKGLVCELGQQKIKNIFQVEADKITNRLLFDSTIDIQRGSLIVKAIFACDKNVSDINAMKKKFETNLRVEIVDKLEKQIQQLMNIKCNIEFQ